jgi:hypothetical protein
MEKVVHKIGCTRSIQSAVLVCEYLRERTQFAISYAFTEPTDRNGWWSADILITTYGKYNDAELSKAVEVCRAFVAGRGEIWA